MPLRNSLHRRNHKERSQLAHRQRFGILEKHKDYVLRARDYHSKQDWLKRLAQKAAERNKDEFYFGMNKQRTERGVHVHGRGNPVLPEDIIKVLKTQDENYVRTMRTAGQKKIEKLKAQLTADTDLLSLAALEELEEEELDALREAGIIPGPSVARKRSKKPAPSHIVFAEDETEAREQAAALDNSHSGNNTAVPVQESTSTVDLGWKTPDVKEKKKRTALRPELGVEDGMDMDGSEDEIRSVSAANRTKLLKELSARLHRDRMLRYAERELEMQKLLMGKGAARKIAGVEKVEESGDDESDEDRGGASRQARKGDEKTYKPRVYKWRAERKR